MCSVVKHFNQINTNYTYGLTNKIGSQLGSFFLILLFIIELLRFPSLE